MNVAASHKIFSDPNALCMDLSSQESCGSLHSNDRGLLIGPRLSDFADNRPVIGSVANAAPTFREDSSAG